MRYKRDKFGQFARVNSLINTLAGGKKKRKPKAQALHSISDGGDRDTKDLDSENPLPDIHAPEAIAEAFADVEFNGADKATPTSVAIHEWLIESEKEIRAAFDYAYKCVRSGKGVPTDTGLDPEVTTALQGLVFDPFDEEAKQEALKALEGQISGENARERATLMKLVVGEDGE